MPAVPRADGVGPQVCGTVFAIFPTLSAFKHDGVVRAIARAPQLSESRGRARTRRAPAREGGAGDVPPCWGNLTNVSTLLRCHGVRRSLGGTWPRGRNARAKADDRLHRVGFTGVDRRGLER